MPPPVPFKVKVLYEFFAENEAEMSIAVGEIVTVVATEDEGWWEGENSKGKRGLFPANYVEVTRGGPPPVNAMANKWTPPAVGGGAKPAVFAVGANANQPLVGGGAAPQGRAAAMANYQPGGGRAKTGNLGLGDSKDNGEYSKFGVVMAGASVRIPNSTKFGQWAWNMGIVAAYNDIVFGVLCIVWALSSEKNLQNSYTGLVGGYTILCGIVTYILENLYGKARSDKPFPSRGVAHIAASIIMWLSMATWISGLFHVTCGVVNIIATRMGEHYSPPPKGSARESSVLEPATSFYDGLRQWITLIKQQNRTGVLVSITVFVIANFALYVATVIAVVDLNNAATPCDELANPVDTCIKLSLWAPWAKGFGAMLDLNCSLILVPVLRTCLRIVYNRSTADQGLFARFLRGLLVFIPIDMNIAFHKLIAKVIVFAAYAHTIIHFINITLAYSATLNRFGPSAWFTGGIICWCMFLLYTAVPDNVKRAQFEIFWYAHHMFIVFFATIMFHGKGGINPNYWKYFPLPGALYVLERGLRFWRSRQPVVVLSVTLMDDVFSLEFAKEGLFTQPYKEGQYLFIQCPKISQIEWHPFTISSAPQEKTVTIHVRCCGPNSWTRRVQHLLAAMGPVRCSFFSLDRQGPNGKIPGKIVGPDGSPLFAVDAPHSAPTQHLGEYSQALIVGAGIGATPVSSALKSIVFHQWRVSMGACFPDHAYFMWVCAHKDIDAFRWLIRIIKEAQDEVMHMKAINPQAMATKTFQFHIWITSVPKDVKPVNLVIDDEIGFWGVPSENSNVAKTRANWDEADLYKVMKCPEKKTVMADVTVWAGRPDWGPRFEEVNKRHAKGDIGVTFCGNPAIAHDLRRQCHRMNRVRQPVGYKVQKGDGLFKLHKENF